MPSKKKKYNARFPAGRIKKIMQSDEEIGKVAQAVPVIISRTLELFVESLLNKTLKITNSRNAKTLSTSHMKQCIMAENRFDFLRELVKNIPDISVAEEAANYNEEEAQSSPEQQNYPDSDTPYDLSMPSTSSQATRASTNGNFQQPLMPLRYAENGSKAVTAGKRALSHEEHMRTYVDQRRAQLKRQAPGGTRAILDVTDEMAEQPKTKKIHSTYAAEKHEDQMRAHLISQAALAKCASASDYLSQVFRENADDTSVHEVDLTNPSATVTRGLLPQEQFLAGKKHVGQGRATAQNITVPSSSVIRHTTSLSTAAPASQLPPKLYRTDSAPATDAGNWQQQQLVHETKSLNVLHKQRRLKHQSQSVPGGFNSGCTPPQKTFEQAQLPPIPAPIVSIDFCNKPVVKIDYSNISMPTQASATPIAAPLSAPATMPGSTANNATGFNFNAEPVFNIDLSNIVASAAHTQNDPPAVATISIGNIATMTSFLNPLVAAPTNLPNNAYPPINPAACRNSAASLECEKSSSVTAPTTSSSTMATNKNNPFFELDEDYDNI